MSIYEQELAASGTLDNTLSLIRYLDDGMGYSCGCKDYIVLPHPPIYYYDQYGY